MNLISTMCRCLLRVWVVVAVFGLLGCASHWEAREADRLAASGQAEDALALLARLAMRDPASFRLKYVQTRDMAIADLLVKAKQASEHGKAEEADDFYRTVLRIDLQNRQAIAGLALLSNQTWVKDKLQQAGVAQKVQDWARAGHLLREILVRSPGQADAQKLLQEVDRRRSQSLAVTPSLAESLKKPVTLQFRDVSLQMVLEVLSRVAEISFILDAEVKGDAKTTVFTKENSIEDTLNLILRSHQLKKKILNASTVLIYADSEDKRRRYEELVVRTFYLQGVEVKKMQEMVNTLIKPKYLYADERLRMMVVRDSEEVISAIERLVASHDIADPEVVLEVEVLEVNSSGLLNAGIQYPDSISASIFGASGTPGQLGAAELRDVNRSNFRVFLPTPLFTLNLKQSGGDAKTLANPRIRVINRQKAKILIGDKVPVVTTTVNQVSSASTESINYLDVGLKLEVQPEIHANQEVTVAVDLEVSNVVKEIRSVTGLLAYQIGTRNAHTVLRLRDGETQVLAGLIKDDQTNSSSGIPGLGSLPGVGRLFSNQTNASARTEIVLLMTPRIVRALEVRASGAVAFSSGTADAPSLRPLLLASAARQQGEEASVPGGPSRHVAADPQRTAPESKVFQVDLQFADSVRLGDQLEMAVRSPSAFSLMEFDLVADGPGLQFVKAASDPSGASTVQAQTVDQVTHVRISRPVNATQGLPILRFRATAQTPGSLNLTIQNLRVVGSDGAELPVGVALPRPLAILR